MNQRKYLEEAQTELSIGPAAMARLLDTNFNTYKAWLYEQNPMPGVVKVAVDLIISKKINDRNMIPKPEPFR